MTKKPTPEKSIYITCADGYVGGNWYPKGAEITLTASQARYENVTPKDAPKAPKGKS